jgi:hypothetical protein
VLQPRLLLSRTGFELGDDGAIAREGLNRTPRNAVQPDLPR